MKTNILRFCSICGNEAGFIWDTEVSFREARCPRCGANVRNSDLAKIIVQTFSPCEQGSLADAASFLRDLEIFEAQSSGPVHDTLFTLPHYTCSEFYPDTPSGKRAQNGIICQDLQDLTFPSETFDLILTQDVLEHVLNPERAFSELSRVLKPGGYHIFTVPHHEGRATLRRVSVENGKVTFKYPPVYHGDPLRPEGALVCTDFGSDLGPLLRNFGFSTELIACEVRYTHSEIPYIVDEKEYQRYLEYSTRGDMLKYFTYNSWVCLSRKTDLSW